MDRGPCPPERPSAWLVIACANSCGRYHDGVRSANRIDSREKALDCLREVAQFFRQTEPHSPVAYLAEKAARWGEMPLHEWLHRVLGDGDALTRLRDVLDVRGNQATK